MKDCIFKKIRPHRTRMWQSDTRNAVSSLFRTSGDHMLAYFLYSHYTETPFPYETSLLSPSTLLSSSQTLLKQFSKTLPSHVKAVPGRKCNGVNYPKTGQKNGQDSQEVVAVDNNQLTDGEGPSNLNLD